MAAWDENRTNRAYPASLLSAIEAVYGCKLSPSGERTGGNAKAGDRSGAVGHGLAEAGCRG